MKIFGKELTFNEKKVYHAGDKPTPAEIGAASSTHNHQASQVTFTDGKTFQQKLDDGSLKGPKGDTGATGAKGATGATGAQGPAGVTPTIKAGTVTTGNAGTNAAVTASTSGTTTTFNFTIPKGANGATGATGPQGPKGDTGAQGPQGVQGPQGPKGDTGAKGATGTSMRFKGAWSSSTAYVCDSSYVDVVTSGGNTYRCKANNTNQAVTNTNYWEIIAQKGATGSQGPKGDTGAKGATGAQGPQGPKGDTGATGPQGPKGATGATGANGATGPQGPKGDKGATGAQGPQGPAGAKGADGLTTSVTVGSTKYTHSNGNITIPAYPTALKNPTALTLQFNGTTNKTYDGSSAQTLNITPAAIGAAASSHTHNYAASSSAGGNANAAVKLATARTINGTSFDGSANITTANWGTARNIQIGNTAKSVNGSANVSWSLSEIGAASSSHNHDTVYLKSGGSVDGTTVNSANFSTTGYTQSSTVWAWIDGSKNTSFANHTPTIAFIKRKSGLNAGFRFQMLDDVSLKLTVYPSGWQDSGAWNETNAKDLLTFSKSNVITMTSMYPNANQGHDLGATERAYNTVYTRYVQGNNGGYLALCPGAGNPYGYVQLDKDGYLYPTKTGGYSLGTGSYRYHAIYLVSSPNVSSDRNLKRDIKYISNKKSLKRNVDINDNLSNEDFYDFIKDDLDLVTYKYLGRNLSQDVSNENEVLGFIANDIADTKVGKVMIKKNNENLANNLSEGEDSEIGSYYSYDMGTYISVLAGALKEAISKIETLESQIAELTR